MAFLMTTFDVFFCCRCSIPTFLFPSSSSLTLLHFLSVSTTTNFIQIETQTFRFLTVWIGINALECRFCFAFVRVCVLYVEFDDCWHLRWRFSFNWVFRFSLVSIIAVWFYLRLGFMFCISACVNMFYYLEQSNSNEINWFVLFRFSGRWQQKG